ncbi:MAG: DUF1801 domain-containing protein [Thermomicrobiales bacterium]
MARKTQSAENDTFTAAERAAMKERAAEAKAAAKKGAKREDGERDILAKIAEMPEPDRTLAQRIHELVAENAPDLMPRTWYGMPAYAKDDKVLCFFQPASKFEARYSTLGFNDVAALDDGTMWPVTFALTALTEENESRIAALIRQAVG